MGGILFLSLHWLRKRPKMKVNTRREKFFSESLKLIHEKGFKATTMRDIAERMNFEVANIYNYIDSKQALLETFLLDIAEQFHSGIDNISQSSYSPLEKLKAVINLHVQLTAQNPYVVSLLHNEWRSLKEPNLTEFLQGRNEYGDKVQAIIEEGMKIGEIRKMDPEIATRTFLAAIRWIYDRYIDYSLKINPFELEKQISDIVLRGLAK